MFSNQSVQVGDVIRTIFRKIGVNLTCEVPCRLPNYCGPVHVYTIIFVLGYDTVAARILNLLLWSQSKHETKWHKIRCEKGPPIEDGKRS